jgi:hypothetical protein
MSGVISEDRFDELCEQNRGRAHCKSLFLNTNYPGVINVKHIPVKSSMVDDVEEVEEERFVLVSKRVLKKKVFGDRKPRCEEFHLDDVTSLIAYYDANGEGPLATLRDASGHEIRFRGVCVIVKQQVFMDDRLYTMELHVDCGSVEKKLVQQMLG